MIQSLVKPGMMNSSDWRYGCSLIRKDRRGFLAGYFLGGKNYYMHILFRC